MISAAPEWWSWADILQRADRLGIPNFQRGAVWDTGNRTALLESIYEQSPCGSFVLWAPDDGGDPLRHGVPIRSFGAGMSPLWLVDGQQRTRTMLDTFEQLLAAHRGRNALPLVRPADLAALEALSPVGMLAFDDEDDDRTEGDAGAALEDQATTPVWMVVLPAMPVFERGTSPLFGAHSESRSIRRGPVFRRLQPRPRSRNNTQGKVRPVPPIPQGAVPLASLVAPDGVFGNAGLRRTALAALSDFAAGGTDSRALDDLLPWGPQFVCGHALESAATADVPAIVMTWEHIGRRRREAAVAAQVERLAMLLAEDWQPVFGRFADMLTGNRFAVGSLPPSNVSAAIDAYVRINRAGIRVRAEEQALALLSRARTSLLDDLAEFIRRRDGGVFAADGRTLLGHESERHMGFPLWMATVTRFAALYLLGDSARAWLRTTAIERDTFSYRLDRIGPHETSKGKATWAHAFDSPEALLTVAVKQASAALLLLDDILTQELHLDHRMARHQTAALTPLLELFARVPAEEIDALRDDVAFRAAIARMAHCALLHPWIDQADMESLVATVHGIDTVAAQAKASPLPHFGSDQPGDRDVIHAAIRRSVGRLACELADVWGRHQSRSGATSTAGPEPTDPVARLAGFAADAFEKDVRDSRSLQHRAVGWLYSVERRGGAREFSWSAQFHANRTNPRTGVPGLLEPLPDEEELRRPDLADDSGALYPEKQHLVPFSIATRIVAKGGTRASASPSNAIGNLTWLSRRQNSLDALSDRWTAMDPATDQQNLEARGMLAPANFGDGQGTVLDVYLALSGGLSDGEESLSARREHWISLYKAFCEGRSAWLIRQMRSWLESPLPAEARRWIEA